MDWLDSQKSSPTQQFKSINSSALSFLHSPALTSRHDYWKTVALTRRTFVGKVMFLFFNMLSRLVIAFLPKSTHLSSVTQLCPTLCDPMDCSMPGFPGILKLMSIESVMPSNHLILYPFSSHLQSFSASVSIPMSQFFASGDQNIGVSASASVLPMNIQG